MSKNIADWLGVSMNGTVVVHSLVTAFPVTSHDYGLISNQQDGTSDHDVSSARYYIDPRIVRAHDLILDDCLNPFTAWMRVTNTGKERFINLLGIDRKHADRLLSDDRKHEPTANMVLKFCVGLGIHPAHFQPGLGEKNFGYDRSVMVAITDMLRPRIKKETAEIFRNREIPEKDLKLCLIACIAEEARFQEMQKNNSNMEYLKLAMRLTAATNPKGGIGLRPGFNYLMGYHHTDVFHGLKLVEQSLEKRVGDSKEKLQEISFLPANLKISLVESAELLFGDRDAEPAIDLIVSQIEEFNSGSHISESFWDSMGDDILSGNYTFGEIEDSEEYLPFPGIQDSFEINARKLHLDPTEIKKDFLENLQIYMRVREKYLTILERTNALEERLSQFCNWYENPGTERHEIRLFRNSLLIAPFLPPPAELSKIKMLSASTSQNRKTLAP